MTSLWGAHESDEDTPTSIKGKRTYSEYVDTLLNYENINNEGLEKESKCLKENDPQDLTLTTSYDTDAFFNFDHENNGNDFLSSLPEKECNDNAKEEKGSSSFSESTVDHSWNKNDFIENHNLEFYHFLINQISLLQAQIFGLEKHAYFLRNECFSLTSKTQSLYLHLEGLEKKEKMLEENIKKEKEIEKILEEKLKNLSKEIRNYKREANDYIEKIKKIQFINNRENEILKKIEKECQLKIILSKNLDEEIREKRNLSEKLNAQIK
jgi:hypothetical protein